MPLTSAVLSRLLSLPSQLRRQALTSAFISTRTAARPAAQCLARTYATYNTNFEPSPPAQSSVNHDEVSHFNALAASWWDPHGSSRLLHLMNPLRHDFMRKCFDRAHPGRQDKLQLLDIGCGAGIFAESAARRVEIASVTAIDPTPGVIAVAQKHQRSDPLLMQPGRLTYRNIALEHLAPEEKFDVISLFEVIEHIRSPSPFLRTILQHLKPGGWLVGSTIARTGVSWLTTKFVAEDLLRIVPRGTHEWSQYINPGELRDWVNREELVDASTWQVTGVVYVPGLGWKEVGGSEDWGNYFFGVQRKDTAE